MRSPQVYPLDRMTQVARILLALILCLTVVGIPVGLWVMLTALTRIELTEDTLRKGPVGRPLPLDRVARFGIGTKEGRIYPDPNNTLFSAQLSTSHLLLESEDGQRITLHLAQTRNADDLYRRLADRLGPPRPLKVGMFGRMRFS